MGTVCSETLRLLSFLQDLEVAAEFSLTNGVTCLLEALKKSNYAKVGSCCTNTPFLQFSTTISLRKAIERSKNDTLTVKQMRI